MKKLNPWHVYNVRMRDSLKAHTLLKWIPITCNGSIWKILRQKMKKTNIGV